jgi:hypothetical protein
VNRQQTKNQLDPQLPIHVLTIVPNRSNVDPVGPQLGGGQNRVSVTTDKSIRGSRIIALGDWCYMAAIYNKLAGNTVEGM